MSDTPNTFGTANTRVRLVDPRIIPSLRARFGRNAIRELAFANSLYVPIHETPARGWILLTRQDFYSGVQAYRSGYGTTYQLTIQGSGNDDPVTLKNLAVVQARLVTCGKAGDPNGVYLVELTDARGVLNSRWFSLPTGPTITGVVTSNSYYNILTTSYGPYPQYYPNSLNGTVPWTWSTMIQDVWEQMSLLNVFPGLPVTPTGTPTNWNLVGVSAWQALCSMLDHLGMAISCDLTSNLPYKIVKRGLYDAAFAAKTTEFAPRLEDDFRWLDVGAARVPGTIIVFFRRVNEQFGTEETVCNDTNQWATRAAYCVSIEANTLPEYGAFDQSPGVAHLWDDFPVRFDVNGNPLSIDVAEAVAIATERAKQYYQKIYDGTLGYMYRVYGGAFSFATGSEVDGVCWRQDYRHGRRMGWVTEVCRGEAWNEVFNDR